MLKKLILVLVLGLGGSVAGLVLGQSQAFACSNGVCGYFKDGNDKGWCNVLPDTSIRWGASGDTYYPDYCWLNSSGGTARSRLDGDADTTSFINDMSAYLNESSGTSDFIKNSQAGAAFLVDDMLGRDYHNGSTGNGINDARAQFGNWSNIIRALGANQCATGSGQMTCPGKSFGINWNYAPPYFCSSPVNTSGYDPWANDTPIYWTAPNSCDHDWNASKPEIVFYWVENGVTKSFHIGSLCGNAQSRADKLPPVNNLPTGTITVSCTDPNTGLQNAHITFRDPDAATSGEVTVNGWTSSIYTSSGAGVTAVYDVPLPLPPTTDAYTKQTVTLLVHDTGPLGNGSWVSFTAQSAAPCVLFACSGPSTNPDKLDPYMTYSAAVGVKASVGQTPPTPTIDIASIVTPGGATYYTHGQIGATNNNGSLTSTFAGVPPTGGTGMYTVNWRLYSNGALLKSCSGTFPVVNLPYLNVYGGDVMAGSSPSYSAGVSTCSTDNSAGVFSWNNHSTDFSGAGSQYAVQALAAIVDFASGLGSSNTPPTNLSFANSYTPADPTKLNLTTGLFGGYFGAGGSDCDFTSDITTPPISGAAATAQITALPAQLPNSSQTIYANGDVYISRDIAYTLAGWADISKIPFFKLVVVGGNIYIGNNVGRLDGLYVAEPTGNVGGRIFTCATGLGADVDPTLPNTYTTCNKRLVINGAFVARYVAFGRTYGSLGQAKITDSLSSNHDAEVFNYTPELWLPRSTSSPSGAYTAITGLPPVL